MNAPEVEIGEQPRVRKEIRQRHPMKLQHQYSWEVSNDGVVIGSAKDVNGRLTGTIQLEQLSDGVHWKVSEQQMT
jgi:hypothetical protein